MEERFELVRRPPSPRLAGIVLALTGYRESASEPLFQREAAPLAVPLIVSLGTPFEIGLGREPGSADRQGSFAAGLFAGPVNIRSDGGAACVQADLSPLGAFRVLGGAMPALAARMVDVEDLFGAAGRRLRESLGATPCWGRRFDVLEAFLLARTTHAPSPEVAEAWRRLASRGGEARIGALAAEIGWSRAHLHRRFRAEVGVGPKTIARLMRFRRACALVRSGAGRWASVAAGAGYADQAHLAREFVALAGEAPTAWARRQAAADPRLAGLRALDDGW
jgi:AraC-like DNA-binding protein